MPGAWLKAHWAKCVVMKPPAAAIVQCAKRFARGGSRGCSSTRLRTRRFAEAPGQLAKTDTIDAVVTAAHGTTFLDLHTLKPRSAFLDPLADLLVLCERHREAQMLLQPSTMGVRDPVLWTEGQRCSCLGRFAGRSGSLEACQAGDSCSGGPGVDVARAPGSER